MKSKRIFNKLTSLLLSLILVAGLSAAGPLPAFAEGSAFAEGGDEVAGPEQEGEGPGIEEGAFGGGSDPSPGEPGEPGEPVEAFAANVGTAAQLKSALENQDTPIHLTADISYTGGIVIDAWALDLYMDGFDLNVVNPAGTGLTIRNGSLNYYRGTGTSGKSINITGKGRGVCVENGALKRLGTSPYTNVNVTLSGALGGAADAVCAINCNDWESDINYVDVNNVNDNNTANSRGVFADSSIVRVYGSIRMTGAGSIGAYSYKYSNTYIYGDTTAVSRGVLSAGGSTVDAKNVAVTGTGGVGVYAVDTGSYAGVGDVKATGAGSTGIYVSGIEYNNVFAGNVEAVSKGIYCARGNCSAKSVTVSGAGGIGVHGVGYVYYEPTDVCVENDVVCTGAGSTGALSQLGAYIEIYGNVSAGAHGVTVQGGDRNTWVRVDKKVTVSDAGCIGLDVSGGGVCDYSFGSSGSGIFDVKGQNGVGIKADGAKVESKISVNRIGAGAIGAHATNKGEVNLRSIDGNVNYVKLGTTVKTKYEKTSPTSRPGYWTYTAGGNTVLVERDLGTAMWVNATATNFYTVLAEVQDPTSTNPNYGKGVRLTQNVSSSSASLPLDSDDIVIDLQAWTLAVGGLVLSDASLELRGTTGALVVNSGEVALNNGRLTTPAGANPADQASVNINYGTCMINANSGSIVDIKCSSSTTAPPESGIIAKGGSKVKLSGNVYARTVGVNASGEGTVVDVIGDVASLDTSSSLYGVRAADKAEVTVRWSVASKNGIGVRAESGARVTVNNGGPETVVAPAFGVHAYGEGTSVLIIGEIGSASVVPDNAICAIGGAHVSVRATHVYSKTLGAYACGKGTVVRVKTGYYVGTKEPNGIAAFADDGAEVYIDSDLFSDNANSIGAKADRGGTVIVDGTLIAGGAPNYTYVSVNDKKKEKTDNDQNYPKQGYMSYTEKSGSVTSAVHVKMTNEFVCRIGNTYYTDFRKAWDALKNGDTMTMLRSFTYNNSSAAGELVLRNKDVTIDVAGYILNLNYTGTSGQGLYLTDGAKLVFDGGSGSEVSIGATGGITTAVFAENASLVMSDRFIKNKNILEVAGNANGLRVNHGSATVTGVIDSSMTAVRVENHSEVRVLDYIKASDSSTNSYGLSVASNNSKVTVGGNVSGRAEGITIAGRNNSVEVAGNVSGGNRGIYIYGPMNSVSAAGDVTATNAMSAGLLMEDGAAAYIGGNVTGELHGVNAQDPGTRAVVEGMATGKTRAVYSRDGAKVWAESAFVPATSTDSTTYGVSASGGGEIFISGNVTNSSSAMIRNGAVVQNGGEVTIGGAITGAGTYIMVNGEIKNTGQYITPTTKKGYRTFTDSILGFGTNTVWVKDGNTIPVILSPDVLPNAFTYRNYQAYLNVVGTWGDCELVSGALPPGMYLGGAEIYGAPTLAGTYTFSILTKYGSNVSDPSVFTLEVLPGEPVSGTISPSHAILTNTSDVATFSIDLKGTNVNYGDVDWDYESGSTPMTVIGSWSGKTFSLRATAISKPETITVTASYFRGYFSATIEILPGGVTSVTAAKVLETKVTVNKAKTEGALLPVLITNQQPGNIGVMSDAAVVAPDTGSTVISEVRLVQYDSKTKVWDKVVPGYKASMHAGDNRHIEISADGTAKAASNVKVMLRSQSSSAYIDAGNINLSVTEKWPKLTVKAGQPNIMYPNKPAEISVTSPDGACTVHSVKAVNGADDGKVIHTQNKLYADPVKMGHKAGSVSSVVNVSVAGYKQLKTMPSVNVKVVKETPKVKLSQASVVMTPRMVEGVANYESAEIRLLSADKNIPLESGYKISGVDAVDHDAGGKTISNDAKLEVNYDKNTGIIHLRSVAGSTSGTQMLEVKIDGGQYCVYLPLKVTVLSQADLSKLSASSSVKEVIVNTAHSDADPQNFIADIPITASAGNYRVNDWEVYVGSVADGVKIGSAGSLFNGVITPVVTGNNVSLLNNNSISLNYAVALAPGKTKSWTLNIVSPRLTALNKNVKPVQVKLTITGKPHTAAVKVSGKLDVADPRSKMTGTLTFANTMSEVRTIQLWDMKKDEKSKDYDIVLTGANAFEIKVKPGREAEAMSGGPRQFDVDYSLKNDINSGGLNLITIAPTHSKGKAWQSRKEVTLYTSQPVQPSESVEVRFTAPANVTLGAVRINEASLAACKFSDGKFILRRLGPNEYAIRFYNDAIPKVIDKNGKAGKLKPSYNLKLELWATGTYQQDWSGEPVALGYYDAKGKWVEKTKPTLVNLKVNVK